MTHHYDSQSESVFFDALALTSDFSDLDDLYNLRVAAVQRKNEFLKKLNAARTTLSEDQEATIAQMRIQMSWKKTVKKRSIVSGGTLSHQDSFSLLVFEAQQKEKIEKCIHAFRAQNLRSLAFGEEGNSVEEMKQHLGQYKMDEQVAMFNAFGLSSQQSDQIRLFCLSTLPGFKSNIKVIESFGMACLRCQPVELQRPCLAIAILRSNLTSAIQGMGLISTHNFLGDAYQAQFHVAHRLFVSLATLVATTTTSSSSSSSTSSLADQLDAQDVQDYRRIMFDQLPSSTEDSPYLDDTLIPTVWCKEHEFTLQNVWKAMQQAYSYAVSAYHAHFEATGSFEPVLREITMAMQYSTCLNMVPEHLKDAMTLTVDIDQLLGSLPYLMDIAECGIKTVAGDESKDYWSASGLMELYCMRQQASESESTECINRMFDRVRAPHQLGVTVRRLRMLHHVYVAQGNEFADHVSGVINTLDKGRHNLLVEGNCKNICKGECTQSVDIAEGLKRKFMDQTFSLRGIIDSPRPFYIPGGLQLAGARVPDMIVSKVDSMMFAELLSEWNLDDITDPQEFIDKCTPCIRACFRTKELQDLHSESHGRFDAISDAAILLSGINPKDRKGTQCITNVSASLMFFGDCREHAITLQAFFDYWQLNLLRRKMCEAVQLMNNHSDEKEAQDRFHEIVHQEIPQLIGFQIRCAHVSVYSTIQMDDIYQPTGYEPGKEFVPKQRSYSIEDVRNGVSLSEYELSRSILVINYQDGTTKTMTAYWNAETSYWGMDNENGVPSITDLDQVESVLLLNAIEQHTMSFSIVPNKQDLTQYSVHRCDSFYNEKFRGESDSVDEQSPYEFGSGEVDITVLDSNNTLLNGGKMVALNASGEQEDIPVFLSLLPYSRRTDSPALMETTSALRFLGVGLCAVNTKRELELNTDQNGNKVFPKPYFDSRLNMMMTWKEWAAQKTIEE
eukprot:TRINITY_DN200_c0_g1_i1.p1 TRINITY_DN200_c0_g1~~TRINITY_DN200_c0_g1_i1.p1  ORF type:complete len:956 (+),score=300.45 TRINITY_DN200_c0_g1_i1:401-3268(+)